jgi:hypothetical protein
MPMPGNDTIESSQVLTVAANRGVDLTNAPAVRLQTLDVARHVAIDPNGKRYVVATFDDRHIDRGYVTAVYPQQNGYLTLVRLLVCELKSETRDGALLNHVQLINTIQQGKLTEFVMSLQKA